MWKESILGKTRYLTILRINVNEKSYKGEIRFKYHICTPESKFACQSCTFRAIELPELLTHVQKGHGKPLLPCVYCEYKTSNQSELCDHIEEKHVHILLSCSHCDFKTLGQNCLTMHVETARNENCLKEHVLSEHGDSAIITIVGNQQILLNEMMSSFEILLLREELTELKDIQKQERKEKATKEEEDKKKEDDKKEDKKTNEVVSKEHETKQTKENLEVGKKIRRRRKKQREKRG